MQIFVLLPAVVACCCSTVMLLLLLLLLLLDGGMVVLLESDIEVVWCWRVTLWCLQLREMGLIIDQCLLDFENALDAMK